MSRTVMETLGMREFDFAHPTADAVVLEDVAHGLAHTCRFGGFVDRFYSVAEHACLVRRLVVNDGYPELALAALHHDSHEAYIGDLPTPLKHALGDRYRELRDAIDVAIAAHVGIDPDLFHHPVIMAADEMALRWEAAVLKESRGLAGIGNLAFDDVPDMDPDWRPGVSPDQAKAGFLEVHRETSLALTCTPAFLSYREAPHVVTAKVDGEGGIDVVRPMRVIGLTGPARAGKDTVAAMIADHHGFDADVIRHGFADALKLSAAHALDFDAETLDEAVEFCNRLKVAAEISVTDDGEHTSHVISGRRFLQLYGTEAHRGVFGDDFWLDVVLPEGRDDCDVLVIPDVRFENEAQRVRDRGGEVWRVERPGVEPVDAHASEVPIPDNLVDRIVWNDGSLNGLRRKVSAALSH